MNKQEIMEIKKQYTINRCSIQRIAGCYVNCNKEIVTRFCKPFLSLSEEEIFKYLEIFKKGLSGGIGKTIRTLSIPECDCKKALSAIINSNASSAILLDTLYEKIIDCIADRTDAYLILIMINAYDIPNKNADNLKDGESDEVYRYISVYLCPMKLEKPGLAYCKEKDVITKKETRWCVEAPEFSFIYPSFESRSSDYDKVTVYTKAANNSCDNLIKGILSCDTLISAKEQKELFTEILEQAVAESDDADHIEAIKCINESIADQIKECEGALVLKANDIKEILKKSHISTRAVDDIAADNVFTAEVISSPDMEISMEGIKLKVKAEVKGKLLRRTIEGREYLLISVDNQPLIVNGVSIS